MRASSSMNRPMLVVANTAKVAEARRIGAHWYERFLEALLM